MDDQTAVSKIKQGVPGGLEALVARYQVKAVYTAFMILHDQSLAEEAAQAAFVRVVEKIDQFDDDRPFAPWFFKIVVNHALKMAQGNRRLVSLDEEPPSDEAVLADWLVDPHPSPERILEVEQSSQMVWAALKRLAPEQRAVVVMRYYLEMSEAEMAARLNRPLSTIKWWLRAARKRLGLFLQASRSFEDRGQER